MKVTFFHKPALWLAAIMLTMGPYEAFSLEALTQPRITRIVKGTNLVVTVRIPDGWQSVTLESRKAPDRGAWVPRSVLRGKPLPGKVAFQMPLSSTGVAWRVRGERKSSVPLSFFAGTRSFSRRQSSLWRADPGMGLVYALRADGNLVPNSGVPAPEARQVSESDIWKKAGNTLYFFNQYRGLQVIDLADPDAPVLRGELRLPAVGEQLYVLDSGHVALLARDAARYDQSRLVIVDVSGETPRLAGSVTLQGSVCESRLVGTALYIALQRGVEVSLDGIVDWQYGTAVVSFDLSTPEFPIRRSDLWYPGWGTAVAATDRFLFLALQGGADSDATQVKVLDIASADGTVREAADIVTAGRVGDKFKMNFSGSVFSVFSEAFERPAPGDPADRGTWLTTLETFSLADATNPVPLGRLDLAPGERLFATRFDGARAYAVTFEQVDPLWVLDLTDPAHPGVAGSVDVPGWSTYIHPLGDRLVTVGVESGRTAVSLFDVSDPAKAALRSRVRLGGDASWSEANWDEKAFSVFPEEGLILVPFEGWSNGVYASQVSLIDLGADSLMARGAISGHREIRRTAFHGARLLALSGKELLSVDLADRDQPEVKGVLELSFTVNRVLASGDYLLQLENASAWTRSGEAVLRVAAKARPDAVLTHVDLGLSPVVGACVRDGRLHLLQNPEGGTNLLMTILDLSALPVVGTAGQVGIPASGNGYGEFEAVWPMPDLLVWVSRSYGFGPLLMVNDVISTLNPATLPAKAVLDSGVAFRFCPWWYAGGVQLLALKVTDPASPECVSRFQYAPAQSWGFSAPFAAQGRIHMSHEQSKQDEVNGMGTGTVMNTSTGASIGVPGNVYGDWRVAEFMDVIDYADPVLPTARHPVRIPGQLAGVSPDGALIYAVGSRRAFIPEAAEENEAVSACAYDGVHAYLVDYVPLPKAWPRPVRVDEAGRVFLGRAYVNPDRASTLEAWSLSAEGRFLLQDSVDCKSPASEINCFGNLLALQEGSGRISLFDATDPARLAPCGEGETAGGLWTGLSRAWGSLDDGLWIPLDDYGLLGVDRSPEP